MRSALLVETEDELLVVPIVLLVLPPGIVSVLSAAETAVLPPKGVATAVFLAARLEAVAVAVLFAVRLEAVLLPVVAVATAALLAVEADTLALPAKEVEMSLLLAVAAATADLPFVEAVIPARVLC